MRFNIQNLACISWVKGLTQLESVQSGQSLNHVQLFATPWTCSTPGLPVHHQLPEYTQSHAHWVSDAIQPSHPLSSHSPPAFNLSEHQGLFQWVSSSHQVAQVLEFQLQYQDWFPLGWTGWISLQSKGLSTVFSNTTVQLVVQFFGTQLSLESISNIHTWPLEKA